VKVGSGIFKRTYFGAWYSLIWVGFYSTLNFLNMKKFFTRSFTILSLVSFAIGIYFIATRDEVFAYAYNTLGASFTLVAVLIKERVPEED